MNEVIAEVRISNIYVPFLNISKYPQKEIRQKLFNDEMGHQLLGSRDTIPQGFAWYRDFISFDMLTDYQTFWVKIAVSETLEIDSVIAQDMKSGNLRANVIILPFQVAEDDRLYIFGDYDEDVSLSFTLPAGNYQLLFQNRDFTREEIEASPNFDCEDMDYDDCDTSIELCKLTFIPTEEVIKPQIIVYKGCIKSKTPPNPLTIFNRNLHPSNPANYTNANLTNADFSNTELVDADFSNANLTGVNFSGATLCGATFKNANLSHANLSGAIIWDVNFSCTNFTNTIFDENTIPIGKWHKIWEIVNQGGEGAQLADEYFVEANLSGANLTGANLTNASLWDANLSSINLTNANLTNANLGSSNLINANLTGANLENARLHKANFQGANLEGVNFKNADFYQANLEDANLRGANLENARLLDAKITNAHFGNNSGISESLKSYLIARGAIFEDS
ncbi:MAG: pentapeptide repeat-containing protein [Rivularia sp. (in: cyanobacteria)]